MLFETVHVADEIEVVSINIVVNINLLRKD